MTSPSEQLIVDLDRLKQSIKRKHRAFKLENANVEQLAQKRFKPIIEPLNVMSKALTSKGINKNTDMRKKVEDYEVEQEEVEQKPLGSVEDDATLTLTPQTPKTPKTVIKTPKTMTLKTPDTPSQRIGKLSKMYIDKVMRKEHDVVYGVHFDPTTNEYRLGSKKVTFSGKNNIIIDGKNVGSSQGLYELLFTSDPDENLISKSDINQYKMLLESTGVHLNKLGNVKSNPGTKYKNYIQKMFPPKSGLSSKTTTLPTGSGMMITDTLTPIKYVYWNDPNELCDRLRLLLSSKSAGHSAHDVEISSIIEELREIGIITGGEMML